MVRLFICMSDSTYISKDFQKLLKIKLSTAIQKVDIIKKIFKGKKGYAHVAHGRIRPVNINHVQMKNGKIRDEQIYII